MGVLHPEVHLALRFRRDPVIIQMLVVLHRHLAGRGRSNGSRNGVLDGCELDVLVDVVVCLASAIRCFLPKMIEH